MSGGLPQPGSAGIISPSSPCLPIPSLLPLPFCLCTSSIKFPTGPTLRWPVATGVKLSICIRPDSLLSYSIGLKRARLSSSPGLQTWRCHNCETEGECFSFIWPSQIPICFIFIHIDRTRFIIFVSQSWRFSSPTSRT